MTTALIILNVILGLLACLSILVQEKGSGFGEAIGGTGGGGNIQTQKRGAEKVISRLSIVLIGLFMLVSLVLNFI